METNAAPHPESNRGSKEVASEATNNPLSAPAGNPAPPKKARNPRRQKAVIDRIEEGRFAVLLVGRKQLEKVVPVEQLPEGAKAGSWLKVRVMPEGVKDMTVDEEETQAARGRVESKLDMLRSRQGYFKPVSAADVQNRGNQLQNPLPAEPLAGEGQPDNDQK
jgi:hypothetical protein